MRERVLKVWCWYLHLFRRYRKKTRGAPRRRIFFCRVLYATYLFCNFVLLHIDLATIRSWKRWGIVPFSTKTVVVPPPSVPLNSRYLPSPTPSNIRLLTTENHKAICWTNYMNMMELSSRVYLGSFNIDRNIETGKGGEREQPLTMTKF